MSIEAPPAFKANDAVRAYEADPNNDPVKLVAVTLPVIVTLPLTSKMPFKAFSFPIPTLD